MTKGHLIGILLTLILFFIFTNIRAAEEPKNSDVWKNRQEDDTNPSVISGIRTLELIRRLIIDSSRDERSDDNESSSIDAARDYPRFIDDTRKVDSKFREPNNPRREINSTVYEALSKLANIRITDPKVEEISRGKSLNNENFGGRFIQHKFDDFTDNDANADKNSESHRPSKSDFTTMEIPKLFEGTGLIKKKFQCCPIKEIFIPSVDKKMPAYLCTLGKKAFVISSDRFNQESRERFFISLDEKTFRRLNPINSDITSLTSAVSVLPATLVLKRGENDYTVRDVKDNLKALRLTNDSPNYF